MKFRSSVVFFLFITIFSFTFFACKDSQKELKIYSIIHDEETKILCEEFTKKTGIPVSYIRATTGEIINKVIAEKNNPQADVLLGGASNYHIQADKENALEVYESQVSKDFPSYAISPNKTWTGFCILALGIGVNEERFTKKFPNKEYPKTWDDLLDSDFDNEIVMTNPMASSTAYLFVQNQLQRLSWDEGWNYLESLSQLVGQFPDSGSAPPKLIGTGEYSVGIAYLHALAKYKSQGFDIKVIAPPRTVGDVDCVAVLKNAKNMEEAKLFVDFILSKEAQEIMSAIDFTTPTNPLANPPKEAIKITDTDLIDYDSNLAAKQKEEVLEKWSQIVE